MQPFIITGTYRTGTTLIEKLLDVHSGLHVLSQPLPLLYRHLKEVFYRRKGITNKYYVLNDLFHPEYEPGELKTFLENYLIGRDELRQVLRTMEGWDGQYTRFNDLDTFVGSYEVSGLCQFYPQLLEHFVARGQVTAAGTKEILVEEFIPYLLDCGIKVILVIRDPRDVYTSVNEGKGTKFTGKRRPTLFHLRNWRKSITLANTYRDHPLCYVLKYEDLLDNKEKALKGITDFLNVTPFPRGHFEKGIQTRTGRYWKGNSSTSLHSGINSTNKDKYKKYLSPETIGYIEFICHPEMRVFGYDEQMQNFKPETFKEPYDIVNCWLNKNMSTDKDELHAEYRRLQLLQGTEANDPEIISTFYSLKNYHTLRSAL